MLATTNWYLNASLRYSDRGERLPGHAELGYYWQFRNGDGIDDLILRGNGNLHLAERRMLYGEYDKAETGRFRFIAKATVFQEGIKGWAREIYVQPKYFFTESLSIGLQLTYDDSDDWLIWTGGAQVASFQRQQLTSAVDGAWYLDGKQELRLKAQWIGLRARFRQAYDVGGNAEPVASGAVLNDFSLSDVAVQLRYRYEIGPLSDLYVVYNRGGNVFEESSDADLTQQLSDAWHHRTSDAFLVKLRYRF